MIAAWLLAVLYGYFTWVAWTMPRRDLAAFGFMALCTACFAYIAIEGTFLYPVTP